MILLDTNQLRRVLPGNPTLTLLSAAARRCGHTLAITDIVLREVVRQHRAQLEQARKALEDARRELDKLVRPVSRIVPTAWDGIAGRKSVGLEMEFFEGDLRAAFEVLSTDPRDAMDAFEREADHRPPCKANGQGGRDATIYLTALRAARQSDNLAPAPNQQTRELGAATSGRQLPVIFVSEDKGFSDPQDRAHFAPDLRNEIGDAQLILRRDVVSALAEIGYPTEWVDATGIIDRDDFVGMLRDAVTRETLGMLSPAPRDAFPSFVRVGRPRLKGAVRKARQCRGQGLILTTLTGTWSSNFFTRNAPAGLDPSTMRSDFRLRIAADVTALVVQDACGAVVEADFSPVVVTITD
ncbi:hypothetical protein [Alloactinosynnema sp. L-07]|uniref:PIN domain-containing protein n=1 Tax=Alloactinosynnema sp. L-07 TaxID=1653480 RepID=UPI00065EFD16|nr:PIN domain-containing protein [Alloactinosynnema sp. L-07]CRK56810.1 hypothetical protein [Alloactinosynnema sp. L-07]